MPRGPCSPTEVKVLTGVALTFFLFFQCLKQYVELLIKEGLETAISCPDAACPKQGHLQEKEARARGRGGPCGVCDVPCAATPVPGLRSGCCLTFQPSACAFPPLDRVHGCG